MLEAKKCFKGCKTASLFSTFLSGKNGCIKESAYIKMASFVKIVIYSNQTIFLWGHAKAFYINSGYITIKI